MMSKLLVTDALAHKSINLTDENRKVCICNVPYQPVVHDIVPVGQYVTKGDNAWILADSIRNRFIGFGQPVHCLANDPELAFHGRPQHSVAFVVCKRFAIGKLFHETSSTP